MDNFLFKFVPFFIVFVFLVIIAWWITVGVLLIKGADVIQKQGLKSVIETVWEGEKNG